MSTISDLLDGWPVVLSYPVSWGEMDSFGHVNNTVYFRYFEHARIAFFERTGFTRLMSSTGIGPILAHTSCRFRLPLAYPDTVSIATKVTEIQRDRFTMLYRVVSHEHAAIAAEGDGRIVVFDYSKNVKAPLPASVREVMEAL